LRPVLITTPPLPIRASVDGALDRDASRNNIQVFKGLTCRGKVKDRAAMRRCRLWSEQQKGSINVRQFKLTDARLCFNPPS
jgi:hypothetical protein